MKVLLLPCNTGGGHNTAAKAVKEAFDSMDNVECVLKDALSFWNKGMDDLICNTYLEMVKKNPGSFGSMYKISDNWWKIQGNVTKIKSPVYVINRIYASNLGDYIKQEGFDAVIDFHIFPAQALTHLRRKEGLQIPLFHVSTDYACVPFLDETEIDYIFSPHKDCLSTFTLRGISANNIYPLSIPVSQKFLEKSDKAESRAQLGLKMSDKVMLVMTGSMGFGGAFVIVKKMFENPLLDADTKIIVITGNNQELYKKFESEFSGNDHLITVGFTDKIPLYMDAADILLSKPGGLSSTEAIAKGIPLIHTAPIPGCETINAHFFRQHHMSLCTVDENETAETALRLLNDDFMKAQIIAAQKNYRVENSAMQIANFVFSHQK